MENAFQYLALRGIGKDDFAHRCPVEATVRGHRLGAESSCDFRHRGPPGAGYFMGDIVGIDYAGTEFGKQGGGT